MNELLSTRRDILGLPLLAAAMAAMGSETAHAVGVDPTMTMVTPPDKIPWQTLYNFPPGMAERPCLASCRNLANISC